MNSPRKHNFQVHIINTTVTLEKAMVTKTGMKDEARWRSSPREAFFNEMVSKQTQMLKILSWMYGQPDKRELLQSLALQASPNWFHALLQQTDFWSFRLKYR